MTLNAFLWGLVIYTIPGLFVAGKIQKTQAVRDEFENVKQQQGSGYLFLVWFIVVLVWFPCLLWGLLQGWRQLRVEQRKLDKIKAYSKKIDAMVKSAEILVGLGDKLVKAMDAVDKKERSNAFDALLAGRLLFAEKLADMVDGKCLECQGSAVGILFRTEPAVLCRVCGRLLDNEGVRGQIRVRLQEMKESL